MALIELRKTYNDNRALIFDALTSPVHVDVALRAHALAVDDVLISQWKKHGLDATPLSLIAVGGYGRLELFPYSDVDILILHQNADVAAIAGIEKFLSEAWDLGFEIGHSVRSIDECMTEARADATVATALLERRLITGDASSLHALEAAWKAGFDVAHFIKAKRFEQQQRYARFEDTAYNLEPNVKESPGGLRDVQMVLWLSKAINGAESLDALVDFGLLTATELRALSSAYLEVKFLRTHLHRLARRREDRLAFELQTALAESLGTQASGGLRASELVMKRYYQAARRVRLFNDILIDSLTADANAVRSAIAGTCFATVSEKLDVAEPNATLAPLEILQAFQLLYRDRGFARFTPALRRAIVRSADALAVNAFANDACRALFLQFLQSGHGVYHALKEMNELGVLGHLVPPWQAIVGQMQHDLFHVYTVDQHILMVLRNMRRFADPVHSHEYPLCSELMQEFPEREVLYLACLFHDIAKGRGGDHSDLGTTDARDYCTALGMPSEQVDLVAWLVKHHLTMSSVAQKKDIADPAVVREFASLCGSEKSLVALYLLTVADIRGTSPKVWNNWKARLLEQLFRATRTLLTQGASSDFDLLADRLVESRRLLSLYAIDVAKAEKFWRTLDSVYLQRHSADEIAWHARNLFWRVDTDTPVVRTRLMPAGEGLQVMVYVTDQPRLFARVMKVFARLGFSVLDARVHTSKSGYALDTFTVINPGSVSSAYRDITQLLEHEITESLARPDDSKPPALGKASRQQRSFPVAPRIEIVGDELGQRFALEIVAADRTGLLARIADILSNRGVSIETARVNTLGARAEDVFVVSGGRLAEESTRIALETELAEAIA
ncbi:MAG: [protein-PII] uridylyltransferase [Betaproteobacteria bacterium]|nr:MAG: [protein-PII] uridylyltransferase [Betaproteobacteria bacterium]